MRIALFLIMTITLVSCAQIRPLEGGSKDVSPPQLDTLQSTPFLATNTRPDQIVLAFDEWVQLNDAFNQILISPPLEKKPKIFLKGKKLNIEFDDEEILKDETTYSINLGEAIKDLNEGNIASGISYVFSTGNEIDSLTVTGNVVDAYSGNPIEKVKVMLYDNLADSVVRTQKPYYMGITDKAGNFTINYVKPATYKAFALLDQDQDFMYSSVAEAIGFLEEPLSIDTTAKHSFRLFTQLPEWKIKETSWTSSHSATILFNRKVEEISLKTKGVTGLVSRIRNDSIQLWFDQIQDTAQLYVLDARTLDNIDTIDLRPKRNAPPFDSLTLQLLTKTQAAPLKQLPQKPIYWGFNMPIKSIDTTKFAIQKGSQDVDFKVVIDTTDLAGILLSWNWQADSTYTISLFPQGITGLNDQANKDTIRQAFTIIPASDLGAISLDLVPPDSTLQYLVLLKNNDELISTKIIPKGQTEKMIWNSLEAGDYSFELIADTNENGRWDTGDYDNNQQPENVFIKKIEKLRPDWNVEVEWKPNKKN